MKRNTLILVFLTVIGISVFFFVGLNGMQHTNRQLPDSVLFHSAPVLSPEEAMKTFQLEEGFRMELVASEPLVHDPVAMDFDDSGRIWVAEMRGYMPDVEGNGEEKPTGRIVILEDQNGDGVMDQSSVFMDGLVLPRVITVVKGGIVYAEPPNLWFVENRQDKPGKKVLIDSAYAVGGNVEHQPNGMMRALDNWFYNAKSKDRYRLQANGQWLKEETEFRGQWGISQDDFGRIYYNTNSNQLRGDLVASGMLLRNAALSAKVGVNKEIVEDQKVYPIRPTPGVNRGYMEGTLNEAQQLTGFTAACGPLIYRGDRFPEAYQGNAFVCEPSANLVKRNILTESGAYVTGTQAYPDREFLASKDERFRPVNLYNGPDGNLYLVDMYRGLIQHKTYLTDYLREHTLDFGLEKPLGMGRIYRIVYEGNWLNRIGNVFRSAPEVSLEKAGDEELLRYLSHPNGWWRDRAQRLLVERNHQELLPALHNLVSKDRLPESLHALWTLEGMDASGLEILQVAMASEHPKLVAAALRIAGQQARQGDARAVLAMYEKVADTHEEPLILVQLALSLGECMQADSSKAQQLLKKLAMQQGDDALMQEAIVSSLDGKSAQFLALLDAETKAEIPMKTVLRETIANVALQNQMKAKALSPKAERQFVLGKSLYEQTCAGCHQHNGEGLLPIAPPLAGSEWVTGPEERLILVALHGLTGPVTVNGKVYKEPEVQPEMPGLKDNPAFSDEKMAAVLTYVRNAWSNEADAIDASKVKAIRESSRGRDKAFTEQEFVR